LLTAAYTSPFASEEAARNRVRQGPSLCLAPFFDEVLRDVIVAGEACPPHTSSYGVRLLRILDRFISRTVGLHFRARSTQPKRMPLAKRATAKGAITSVPMLIGSSHLRLLPDARNYRERPR